MKKLSVLLLLCILFLCSSALAQGESTPTLPDLSSIQSIDDLPYLSADRPELSNTADYRLELDTNMIRLFPGT